MTALHTALEDGDLGVISEALNDPELQSDWATALDDFGQTVLQRAAELGKTDVLKLLVEKLPDKNLLNFR